MFVYSSVTSINFALVDIEDLSLIFTAEGNAVATDLNDGPALDAVTWFSRSAIDDGVIVLADLHYSLQSKVW